MTQDGYARCVNWESYFAELEAQFAEDAAAERASVDLEAERVRQARLDLATRLRAMAHDGAFVTLATVGDHQFNGTMRAAGTDWCGIDVGNGGIRCVRTDAIKTIVVPDQVLRRSLLTVPSDALAQRATFGYVLRGWARHRTPVLVQLTDSSVATGTIDRAATDHCDFAFHDAHTPRRDGDVSRFAVVPFHTIAAVSPLSDDGRVSGSS